MTRAAAHCRGKRKKIKVEIWQGGSSNAILSQSHLDTGPLTRFFCRFINVSPAYQRIPTHVCLIQNNRWTCRYDPAIRCHLDFSHGAYMYIAITDIYDHQTFTHHLSTHVSENNP